MKELLKSAAIVALITALSGCETIGLREIISPKNTEQKQHAIYPATSLKRCPEKLSTLNITEDEWNALEAEAQIIALMNQGRDWVVEYFRCAVRHNIGADVYEEQLANSAS